MKTICGHCHNEIEMGGGHDCTPTCRHCGVTFEGLDNPGYDSAKIAVSRHQRECDDRPEPEPFVDPEGQFRAERRKRKRIRQWEEKQRKRSHVW